MIDTGRDLQPIKDGIIRGLERLSGRSIRKPTGIVDSMDPRAGTFYRKGSFQALLQYTQLAAGLGLIKDRGLAESIYRFAHFYSSERFSSRKLIARWHVRSAVRILGSTLNALQNTSPDEC